VFFFLFFLGHNEKTSESEFISKKEQKETFLGNFNRTPNFDERSSLEGLASQIQGSINSREKRR